VRLAGRLRAEVTASYSKPVLSTIVSGDVESAAGATASETITQIIVEGNLLFALTAENGARGRIAPFVSGGAGYLRQLHEGQTVVDTGRTLQAGGGARMVLRSSASSNLRVGVRGDIRVIARTRGVSPDGVTHVAPAFGASIFVAF